MNHKSVSAICMTIIILAMAGCEVATSFRENPTVACVRVGGEWSWFSCRRAGR